MMYAKMKVCSEKFFRILTLKKTKEALLRKKRENPTAQSMYIQTLRTTWWLKDENELTDTHPMFSSLLSLNFLMTGNFQKYFFN